jgi:phosphatidylserine decarboxylase
MAQFEPYHLKVEVFEARDLLPKDFNGKSDPYVVVKLGRQRHQTSVIPKTLNPNWGGLIFEFEVDDPTDFLYISVWDKDIIGKDFLGKTKFPLIDLLPHNNDEGARNIVMFDDVDNEPVWFPLKQRRCREKVSGEILLKIGYSGNVNQDIDCDLARRQTRIYVTPDNKGEDDSIDNLHFIDEGDQDEEDDDDSSDEKINYFYSDEDNNSFRGLMMIEVINASNLPKRGPFQDIRDNCDPYVIISFGKNTLIGYVNLNAKNLVEECRKYNNYSDVGELKDLEILDPVPLEVVKPIEFVKDHPDHNNYESTLKIKIKFTPYKDLRRNFWYALAKTYDSDSNLSINYIELQAMLDSIGSTVSDETIKLMFTNCNKDYLEDELTYAEMAKTLEQVLIKHHEIILKKKSEKSKNKWNKFSKSQIKIGDILEEKLIQIYKCPICGVSLGKNRDELDIISHIAVCVNSDYSQIDKFVMGGLISEAYTSRKWYSKVIKFVGYGQYSIGKNNANILVQDRESGLIIEEKMSAFVRLGIRLLYKSACSDKATDAKLVKNLLATLSFRQGKIYDSPSSVKNILPFIKFHKLNTGEILDPLPSFKTFNEFFYRKLKPGARVLALPDNPKCAVSMADCRFSCFQTIDSSKKLWIKGSSFSVASLLDDEKMGELYKNGSLAIFRLAPQDYHRFHLPVDGVLSEPKFITGTYYTVNPMAIRSRTDVYTENVRVVSYMDSEEFGKVAIVCIGAMMVGSIILTSKPGVKLHRMDEHGYFAFGGSTIVVLFQEGSIEFDRDLLNNSSQHLETLIRVGSSIGISTFNK